MKSLEVFGSEQELWRKGLVRPRIASDWLIRNQPGNTGFSPIPSEKPIFVSARPPTFL